MFYIPWEGNGARLEALYALVDEYRAQIAAGEIPVYVDSYSALMRDVGRNRRLGDRQRHHRLLEIARQLERRRHPRRG